MADAPLPQKWKRIRSGIYANAAPTIKVRDKAVERMARKVREVADWLTPADAPMVKAFCQLELLSTHAYAALRAFGLLNQSGDARRLPGDFRLLRQTQATIAAQLGLTPASRLQIKAHAANAALDLVASMASTKTDADETAAADDAPVADDGEHDEPKDGS